MSLNESRLVEILDQIATESVRTYQGAKHIKEYRFGIDPQASGVIAATKHNLCLCVLKDAMMHIPFGDRLILHWRHYPEIRDTPQGKMIYTRFGWTIGEEP